MHSIGTRDFESEIEDAASGAIVDFCSRGCFGMCAVVIVMGLIAEVVKDEDEVAVSLAVGLAVG